MLLLLRFWDVGCCCCCFTVGCFDWMLAFAVGCCCFELLYLNIVIWWCSFESILLFDVVVPVSWALILNFHLLNPCQLIKFLLNYFTTGFEPWFSGDCSASCPWSMCYEKKFTNNGLSFFSSAMALLQFNYCWWGHEERMNYLSVEFFSSRRWRLYRPKQKGSVNAKPKKLNNACMA